MGEWTYILVPASAICIALLTVPLIIRFAHRYQAYDQPGNRKLHEFPMPTLGGISFSLALICIMLFLLEHAIVIALFSGLLVILITGILDDMFHLNPGIKFLAEIIASLLFIYLSGYSLLTFGDLLGLGEWTTGRYHIAVTVFCMIGVINAMNFIDGMDGLAGGVSLVACLFLAGFSFLCGNDIFTLLLLALGGGLTGFLYYNSYPAKIYMGDTGSLVLGYLLSAFCVALVNIPDCDTRILPVSMAVVMGLPIVDAILVMTNRMIHLKNPFYPDNTHIHHRLMRIIGNHKKTVWSLYLLMACCGVLALLVRSLVEWHQFAIGVVFATFLFASIYLLDYRGNRTRVFNSGNSV